MKTHYLLLVLIFVAACKKERTVSRVCKMPEIVLYNQQYSISEWDTIVTMVFDKGFKQPMVVDTFIAPSNVNQLYITHDAGNPKDYIIYLPSVDRLYRLYDITVHVNRQDGPEDVTPDCYHDMDFTLDSLRITKPPVAQGKILVELKK